MISQTNPLEDPATLQVLLVVVVFVGAAVLVASRIKKFQSTDEVKHLRKEIAEKENTSGLWAIVGRNSGGLALSLLILYFVLAAALTFITQYPPWPFDMVIDVNSDWWGEGGILTPALLAGIFLFIPIFYILIEFSFRVWIHEKHTRAKALAPPSGVIAGGSKFKAYSGSLRKDKPNYTRFIDLMRVAFLVTFILYGLLAIILSQLHVFMPDVEFRAVDGSNILGIFDWSVESGFLAFFLMCWALSLIFTALLLGKDLVLPFRMQILIFALIMFTVVAFLPIRIHVIPESGEPYWKLGTMLDFFFAADPETGSIFFFERVIGLFAGGLAFFLTTNVIFAFITSIFFAGTITAIRYMIPSNLFDFLFGWITNARVVVLQEKKVSRHRRTSPVKLKRQKRKKR